MLKFTLSAAALAIGAVATGCATSEAPEARPVASQSLYEPSRIWAPPAAAPVSPAPVRTAVATPTEAGRSVVQRPAAQSAAIQSPAAQTIAPVARAPRISTPPAAPTPPAQAPAAPTPDVQPQRTAEAAAWEDELQAEQTALYNGDGFAVPRANPRNTAVFINVAQEQQRGSSYQIASMTRAAPIAPPVPDSYFKPLASPSDPVPPAIEHYIPHLPQKESLWCWAAAAQQTIGWVNNGRAPKQCAIVALAHGISVPACCGDPSGLCNRTGEIPAITRLVERFGGSAREIAPPRDARMVYDQLRQGRTFIIRLKPTPEEDSIGIRHMIVVRGMEWLRLPNGRLQPTLLYNDPLGEGERSINFEEIEPFFEEAMLVERLGY